MCIVRRPRSEYGVYSNTALNHCLVLLYRLPTAGGNVVKQMPLQSHLTVVAVRIGMERSYIYTNGKHYSLVETLSVMEGIKIRQVLCVSLIIQNCNEK
jgi:hypothetical protein